MISIIIPIYNKENSLKRCIESVINQTYKYIEIILVNDGSTDNSLYICKEYEKKDLRIKVVDKVNGGVSSARNEGIKVAQGKYIQFIDSDDCIDYRMCEKLINAAETYDSDMVICGYREIREKKVNENLCVNVNCDNKKKFEEMFEYLYGNWFINVPWNKLYKKVLIKSYFDQKLSLGEDLLFNLSYLKDVKTVTCVEDCLYNYYIGELGSLTNSYRDDMFSISTLQYNALRSFVNEYFNTNREFYIFEKVYMTNIFNSINGIVLYSNKRYKEKVDEIKQIINQKEVIKACSVTNFEKALYKLVNLFVKYKSSRLLYLGFKLKK